MPTPGPRIQPSPVRCELAIQAVSVMSLSMPDLSGYRPRLPIFSRGLQLHKVASTLANTEAKGVSFACAVRARRGATGGPGVLDVKSSVPHDRRVVTQSLETQARAFVLAVSVSFGASTASHVVVASPCILRPCPLLSWTSCAAPHPGRRAGAARSRPPPEKRRGAFSVCRLRWPTQETRSKTKEGTGREREGPDAS